MVKVIEIHMNNSIKYYCPICNKEVFDARLEEYPRRIKCSCGWIE